MLCIPHDMLQLAGQRARAERLEITFIQGDASQLTVESQFDHVICICEGVFSLYEEGIEPFQYHHNILNNVYSMLKPGGKFLMTALNGFKMIRDIQGKILFSIV
jgi:ubiquinone/menaquinone biosynthesis C-methylase UbiE